MPKGMASFFMGQIGVPRHLSKDQAWIEIIANLLFP